MKAVCQRFEIEYPFNSKHESIKHEHGKFYSLPNPIGMDMALRQHRIKLEGTHHRGIDDARNIAKITAQMLQDGWRVER